MSKKINIETVTKTSLLEVVETIESTINRTTIPALDELALVTANEVTLSNHTVFNGLNLDNDSEFFLLVNEAILKYLAIIPKLKRKINEEFPDVVSSTTVDINVVLTVGLVELGVLYAERVPSILSFLIEAYYTKSGTELKATTVDNLDTELINFVKNLPTYNKANLETLAEIIGEVPTFNTLRSNSKNMAPTDLILSYFKDTFNIVDSNSKVFLNKIINLFADDKTDFNPLGFTGNPFYHIRMFIIDIEMLRLARLKENKRLLESRIIELRNNKDNLDNSKLKTAIAYYEDKLVKLNLKITKYKEA